ncbi:GGDEF domain-containing protein [Planktothrix agardhii]|nr:diguanylate cyclase [Planktothrix agardhii]CAD5924097.1 hypothetical protein NO758_00851 [Planktothrix agardhii]
MKESILLITKALNLYFNQGEIPEFTPSIYLEINQLHQVIELGIKNNEQKILDLENIILSRQEESLQIVLERETAETHLRQCLSIANRHHLSLCVAIINVEDSQLTDENPDFLATPSCQIINLMQELKQILRESDWVAHWETDEFLLAIFSELPGTKIALNRILDRLVNQEESLENNPSNSSVYIGYTKVQPNEHYRACIERINQALQQAKMTGERCVYF